MATQTPESASSPQQTHNPETPSALNKKPVVVGLYGVQGCGKTFLLNQLKKVLPNNHFAFLDGSAVIDAVVPKGLSAFLEMEEKERVKWRCRAIESVGEDCAKSGQAAVVAGHYMFWDEGKNTEKKVLTQSDLETYTHILYLEASPELITQRRQGDSSRSDRSLASTAHLGKWQQKEIDELRKLCRQHGILFSVVPSDSELLNKVTMFLNDFKSHTEEANLSRAKSYLDEVLVANNGVLETMLILDADKTLAAEDTGAMFWDQLSRSQPSEVNRTLKDLFSSPLGYSYAAFRQAVLLYEEAANNNQFEALCQNVASGVTVHPDFLALLKSVAEQDHVGAVVVTCGLRRVWEKVMEREGLADKVKVIGGGRIADGFVISSAVKAALVTHLQEAYRMSVWAFGDGPLDLEMLAKADHAIVVVGDEQTRSKSMEHPLATAIKDHGLRARQVLIPDTASPRISDEQLPIVKLTEPNFVKSIFRRRDTQNGLQVICATKQNSVNLLATQMRNATIVGPDLREVHRRVGWYLAIEFLANLLGLAECSMQHPLLDSTIGYRLHHERETTIVALMRGGEPMAFGVNDAYPLAMFVHASSADDLKLHHLQGQDAVVLVDSVVNTGKTIVEFVRRVRELHDSIHIIVIAGVVQDECVAEGSTFRQSIAHHGKVQLITLRTSSHKYTGSRTSDTGNRLFNTTHLGPVSPSEEQIRRSWWESR